MRNLFAVLLMAVMVGFAGSSVLAQTPTDTTNNTTNNTTGNLTDNVTENTTGEAGVGAAPEDEPDGAPSTGLGGMPP